MLTNFKSFFSKEYSYQILKFESENDLLLQFNKEIVSKVCVPIFLERKLVVFDTASDSQLKSFEDGSIPSELFKQGLRNHFYVRNRGGKHVFVQRGINNLYHVFLFPKKISKSSHKGGGDVAGEDMEIGVKIENNVIEVPIQVNEWTFEKKNSKETSFSSRMSNARKFKKMLLRGEKPASMTNPRIPEKVSYVVTKKRKSNFLYLENKRRKIIKKKSTLVSVVSLFNFKKPDMFIVGKSSLQFLPCYYSVDYTFTGNCKFLLHEKGLMMGEKDFHGIELPILDVKYMDSRVIPVEAELVNWWEKNSFYPIKGGRDVLFSTLCVGNGNSFDSKRVSEAFKNIASCYCMYNLGMMVEKNNMSSLEGGLSQKLVDELGQFVGEQPKSTFVLFLVKSDSISLADVMNNVTMMVFPKNVMIEIIDYKCFSGKGVVKKELEFFRKFCFYLYRKVSGNLHFQISSKSFLPINSEGIRQYDVPVEKYSLVSYLRVNGHYYYVHTNCLGEFYEEGIVDSVAKIRECANRHREEGKCIVIKYMNEFCEKEFDVFKDCELLEVYECKLLLHSVKKIETIHSDSSFIAEKNGVFFLWIENNGVIQVSFRNHSGNQLKRMKELFLMIYGGSSKRDPWMWFFLKKTLDAAKRVEMK